MTDSTDTFYLTKEQKFRFETPEDSILFKITETGPETLEARSRDGMVLTGITLQGLTRLGVDEESRKEIEEFTKKRFTLLHGNRKYFTARGSLPIEIMRQINTNP